jgi:hypothetical protein
MRAGISLLVPYPFSLTWYAIFDSYTFGAGFDFPMIIMKVSIINNTYSFGVHDNYIRSKPLQRRLLLLICLIKGICLDVLTLKHDINIPINTCQSSIILYHKGNEILAKC